MSKGIDYSKWDHLEDDSDDDDEEEEVRGAPRVTRLDAPSRITTTGGMMQVDAHPPTNQTTIEELTEATEATTDSTQQQNNNNNNNNKPSVIPASWTANNGGLIDMPPYNLYWSQDRQVVWCRFRIPPDVPSKDLTVEWSGHIYRYADRFTAVGTSSLSSSSNNTNNNTASFRISHGQQLLLQGDLPHPIHYTEDDDDDDEHDSEQQQELDWEIDRDGNDQRYILLTLPKATPMYGMSIQWKRPLQQVPLPSADDDNTNKSSQFQQAWDEAHIMFREKMAKGEIPKRPDGLP